VDFNVPLQKNEKGDMEISSDARISFEGSAPQERTNAGLTRNYTGTVQLLSKCKRSR
jgi:hypothetical protein